MFTHFQTERLKIRPISEKDLDFAFENWTQKLEIAKYMTWKPHQTKEETQHPYIAQVDSFRDKAVLMCKYKRDRQTRFMFYWFKNAPAGWDEALKSISADNPVVGVGPAKPECPESL